MSVGKRATPAGTMTPALTKLERRHGRVEGAGHLRHPQAAAKTPNRAFDSLEESGYANNPTVITHMRWPGAIARRRAALDTGLRSRHD